MAYDDFDAMIEDDSWLKDSPPPSSSFPANHVSKLHHNKRPKACNIDDLLKDHYRERGKILDRESKLSRMVVPDSEDSDEEFEAKTQKELQFEDLVHCCEKQVHANGAIVEVPKWGETVFYAQRRENFVSSEIKSPIIDILLAAKQQTAEHLLVAAAENEETAETLVRELLVNGWLRPFRFKLDSDIMHWIFHTMIYTDDKNVERSACHFLCDNLQKEIPELSWLPTCKSIIKILEDYGHVGSVTPKNPIKEGPKRAVKGPPQNFESFLCFLTMMFKKRRELHLSYSEGDIQDLVVVVATFLLDRNILKFSILIKECLNGMLQSLTENEWANSCQKIARDLTRKERQVVNCVKLTHALDSKEARLNSLQSSVAIHFFFKITNVQTFSPGVWEILSVFQETDIKRKNGGYDKLYLQMSMADVWFWSRTEFEADKMALESWILFLKSCSFQISSTDWRPYATKVRNRASYLLQVYQSYFKADYYYEES